ncbi:IclR family transcriptional regulator [Rhodococcus sovatensis]|uniref:IclR family transcriptional regulator n=1 Tax=Rhodococcus sovatensis TaxID=1805840 RepID=A0ABZ2PJ11_9NOCA
MSVDGASDGIEDIGGGIRSVERAATVIQAISDAGASGARLVDIVAATNLSKTTAHRIVNTLLNVGWLEQEDEGGILYLGVPFIGFGMTASDRHGLVDLAQPHLTKVAELTGDTVFLSVRVGNRALCIDQAIGTFPVRIMDPAVGDRRPLGSCAGSLALLAWSDDDDDEFGLLTRGANTTDRVPDAATLQGLIVDARNTGYVRFPGLIIPDTVGIAVPIFGANRDVVAALSVSSIEPRMSGQRQTHIVEWLLREADALSRSLLSMNPRFSKQDVRRVLGPRAG